MNERRDMNKRGKIQRARNRKLMAVAKAHFRKRKLPTKAERGVKPEVLVLDRYGWEEILTDNPLHFSGIYRGDAAPEPATAKETSRDPVTGRKVRNYLYNGPAGYYPGSRAKVPSSGAQ